MCLTEGKQSQSRKGEAVKEKRELMDRAIRAFSSLTLEQQERLLRVAQDIMGNKD